MNPPYQIFNPQYQNAAGPVDIKVFDPTLVVNNNFDVRFQGVGDTSKYSIYNFSTNSGITSDRTISQVNEQILPEWGLTSTINTLVEAGKPGAVNNAFVASSISYTPSDFIWLNPVRDLNNPLFPAEDWIQSGPDGQFPGIDDEQVYEKVVDGAWGPFKLTAKPYPGPKWQSVAEAQVALSPQGLSKTSIASVDIIITADKSKWSRAAVVETADLPSTRFSLRGDPSLGKNGQPDNSGTVGLSWFPGYAVNLETGERLNIAFGENSLLSGENGADMKWNPTATRYYTLPDGTLEPVFGGMHYIYVFGHNANDPVKDVPKYDSCSFIHATLTAGGNTNKRNVWKDAMWVSLPMIGSDYTNLNFPDQIPSEAKIRIRIARTYRPYAAGEQLLNDEDLTDGQTYYVASTPVTYAGTSYELGESFTATTTDPNFSGLGTVTTTAPVNGFNPYYNFGTSDLANTTNDVETAKSALDLINVVPNPYYAYSAYETGQLDNRIKVTNLPPKCTVSIFTMSGALVRKFNRDVGSNNSAGTVFSQAKPNTETSLDWDLKNHKGIPIGSGMYLIHVEAPGLGERTVKWFGMTRPLDLDTF
jgi:hypothetical protein